LIKFKFYQPKRSDFTKISSLVTLEFDLIFYIYFADFYLFWNFETVNSELLLNLDQSNSTSFQRFSKKKPARFFRTPERVREHRTKAILKGKSHMSFALCTQHTTLYKAQWKSSLFYRCTCRPGSLGSILYWSHKIIVCSMVLRCTDNLRMFSV
jgi:hypothetical protein